MHPPHWISAVARERLRHAVGRQRGLNVAIELDTCDGADVWILRFRRGQLTWHRGRRRRVDATVSAKREVLSALFEGRRSGVEAFLTGELSVRRNLALAFRLEGLVDHPERPRRFPRAVTVDVDGIPTFCLEAGEGPTVVLLHGLGGTNASFLPTLWDLARDHRVLAPDLPGFGESGKPLRRYHAQFYASWARSFLDATGTDRAHIVGNSMGGRIGIELGLRSPERVRKLVLLAPAPAWKRFRTAVPLVRLLLPELAVLPLPLRRHRARAVLRWMFARPERLLDAWYDAAVDEFMRVFATARGRVGFLSAARQIYLDPAHGEDGFWDRLPHLRPPALFVWGSHDPLVPHRFARHVEHALPQARSVLLDDCGHVPQFEHPAATNKLIREFLASE